MSQRMLPDEPADISVPYILLADAAEAVGGKLYILGGGWERLMIPGFPGRSIKPFALAVGVTVPYSHTNRKFALTVELIDADGGQIADLLRFDLEAGRPPGLTRGASQNIPLGLSAHPEFPRPGRYSFVARIDGEIRNTVSFEIVPLQQVQFVQGPPPPGGS